ncbi:RNA-directed DNA polymerase [Flavisphingomonas formosensis]|uniref:RNA-directed DNA polymerase n=1 Tax=Flavisphingomonas formosensis TaxID=861534 RepID=UPI0012F7A130|nr:RNA-directed DNA polymerase [Sphingomonas formosensis]
MTLENGRPHRIRTAAESPDVAKRNRAGFKRGWFKLNYLQFRRGNLTIIRMNEKALAIRAVAHIRKSGVDDIFRPPLFHGSIEARLLGDEIDYRREVVNAVTRFLRDKKVRNLSIPLKLNIPKNKFAFRAASWIELTDTAKYLALVMKIAPDIERARRPEGEKSVFSYRSRPHGMLFGSNLNYDAFRRQSGIMSELPEYSVKVITDISNFYDRINIHRIEAILASAGCDLATVSKINDVLLSWAGRNSYGVPVGCDGSRLLAEASLINVDNELHRRGIKFVRYVDDFRLFAPGYLEANTSLNILIEALDREGLFLNVAKTKMINIEKGHAEENPEGTEEEFAPIDPNEAVSEIRRVHSRYSSRLVRTYRYPGKEQITRYMKTDIKAIKNRIATELDVADDEIREFIKAFIYQSRREVVDLVDVLKRHVHYLPYVVDAIIKEKNRFSQKEREEIRVFFDDFLDGGKCAEYYMLAAFRLSSEPGFGVLEVCRRFLARIPLTTSPIVMREMVLRMAELGDRDALVALKSVYWNVGTVVRRAIFFCWKASEKILLAEKNAFFRTLNKSESDPLIVRESGKAFSKK